MGHVTIVGQVTEAGRPLQGVDIYTLQGESETDENGNYVLPYGPAKKVSVSARFTKFSGFSLGRSMVKGLEVAPGEIERLDFDFRPGTATLEGVLLYDDVPLEHTRFTITRLFSTQEKHELLQESQETDGSGRFAVHHLPEGKYAVYVLGRGTDVEVSVAEGAMVWRDIELNAGSVVSGEIIGLADIDAIKERIDATKGRELGILSSYVRAVSQVTLVRGNFPENEWEHLSAPRIAHSSISNGTFTFTSVSPGVVSFVIGGRSVLTTDIPAEGIDDLVISLPEEWSEPGRIKLP